MFFVDIRGIQDMVAGQNTVETCSMPGLMGHKNPASSVTSTFRVIQLLTQVSSCTMPAPRLIKSYLWNIGLSSSDPQCPAYQGTQTHLKPTQCFLPFTG